MAEPYYSDDLVTIYHGRCEDIVPDLGRFDLLLTDPPYGIGIDGQDLSVSRANTQVRKRHVFRAWDHKTADEQLSVAMAVCTDSIVWGGNYYSLPPSRGWVVWTKGQDGQLTASDGELAWTSYTKPLRVCEIHRSSVWREGSFHPTQKPVALMTFCLDYAKAEPGWTVLDPFMGSGTTLVACRKAGIKCVGIDAEEKYCEMAVRRVAQRSLFEEVAA